MKKENIEVLDWLITEKIGEYGFFAKEFGHGELRTMLYEKIRKLGEIQKELKMLIDYEGGAKK